MKQKKISIETNFEQFQSSFSQLNQAEKESWLVQCFAWAKQQADSLPRSATNKGAQLDFEHPQMNPSFAFRLRNDQEFFVQEIQTLIENEIHLKQIAGNMEQVFWLSEINSGRILYANPIFETTWGRSCESLYDNPGILIESVHPEDRVQVLVAKPHHDDKPFNQAYRILRPDESIRWIFSHTFIIHDQNGKPAYQFCIAQDITDQKQIEFTLHKTLDRSREQFDLSHKMSLTRKPEAVLKTLMSAFELRSAQRASLLLFDHPNGSPIRGVEVTASWLSAQTHSLWLSESTLYEEPALFELFQQHRIVVITEIDSDPRLNPALRTLLLEGQIQSIVIFPLITSGNWMGCLMVYYEQARQFDYIELQQLKVLVDQATITLYNLQLLEIEAESRHEAERANEIKTKFLAMISHELRTPLTSIIGFTTTLLADDVLWSPDEQHDFIQTIQQEADRLQELIDHLLDLSRLETGMLPITLNAHTLHDIIEDAYPQLQILTKAYSLTLDLPAHLPQINVDAKRVAQVLVNLVRNAATYAPKGTHISITASVRGNFVQVNINDQGPGIVPADHKRVFKAFLRGGDVENGSVQGAGLGLAICKGLVEAHGGRIWIKKKNAPGTTISFTIPLLTTNVPVSPAKEEN